MATPLQIVGPGYCEQAGDGGGGLGGGEGDGGGGDGGGGEGGGGEGDGGGGLGGGKGGGEGNGGGGLGGGLGDCVPWFDGGMPGAEGSGFALYVARLYVLLTNGLGRWIRPTETMLDLRVSAAPEMNPGGATPVLVSHSICQ